MASLHTLVMWPSFDAKSYIKTTEVHTKLIAYLVEGNSFVHLRIQYAEFP